MYFISLLILSVLLPVCLSAPVEQHRVLRLQPVPRNFLDWPALARKRVLASMAHEETVPTVEEQNNFRHLIQGQTNLADELSSDESLPGVAIPDESSSWSSSSWSSSSRYPVSPENWLSYRQIYNYLSGHRAPYQEDSSLSIVSWASLDNSYRNSVSSEMDEEYADNPHAL